MRNQYRHQDDRAAMLAPVLATYRVAGHASTVEKPGLTTRPAKTRQNTHNFDVVVLFIVPR